MTERLTVGRFGEWVIWRFDLAIRFGDPIWQIDEALIASANWRPIPQFSDCKIESPNLEI
jgi:hypothetical protein